MHVSESDFTYQCINCGVIKPDSAFEDTGNSEICIDCELRFDVLAEWNCKHLDYDDYFDQCRDCGYEPMNDDRAIEQAHKEMEL